MKYFVGVFLVFSIAVALAKARIVKNPILNLPRIIKNDKSESRIVRGALATPTQFPYQLSIRIYILASQQVNDYDYSCGGMLLSLGWACTAAHCLTDETGSTTGPLWFILGKFVLTAGSIRRDVVGANGQSREILSPNNVFPHPQYDPNELTYDIGLIRCSPAFTLTIYVAPVALPPVDFDMISHNGTVATASGFGATKTNGRVSEDLLWTNLIIRIPCPGYDAVPPTSFCAQSDVRPTTAICQGDSGGPLTVVYNSVTVVVGIVSFTLNGCGPLPQGFTNITQFRDFIATTMSG